MLPGGRWLYQLVTVTSLGAAALGVVLPVLPTTPFLLVAAWSAARHSPALEARLMADPRVGPHLHAWRRERALSRRARRMAMLGLVVSFCILLATVEAFWIILAVAAVLVTVGAYLATRPEPRPASALERD